MQQSKTLFFAIIGLSILVVIGLFFARSYVTEVSPLRTSIRVVVAPSIATWATQAADRFNQGNSNNSVEIVVVNELIPTATFQSNSAADKVPAAWLAEASFIIALGQNADLAFNDPRSVASSALAWGAYNDKLEQFNQDYGFLSWENVNVKATNSEDVSKLIMAPPYSSAEGLAALISATAFQAGGATLAGGEVSAANQWLTETLGNRNTQLPPTPAQTMASVQGRTLGDFGLLSMASWRAAKLDQNSNFTVAPVEPAIILDYPYAISAQADEDQQKAALAFRDFLLAEAQQQTLATIFLDPALSSGTGVQADGVASQRLIDWANRTLR